MENPLLNGFTLGDLRVEPLTGRYAGRHRSGHLPPRAIEVLLCLAQQPRHLVSRDDLLAKVWGNGHGSSEALTHAIGELRHAFGDHADAPCFIQTVPRRGYRLLVEPRTAAAAGPGAEAADTGPGFWKTLFRHGVVQAAVAYLVAGWLLIQVADATFENLGLPDWSLPFVTFVVIGGFPLVLLLSWFLEFAEGRMERDRGEQATGWLQGLERNYLAIVAAYVLAVLGVGVYQLTVGIGDAGTPVAADERAEPGYIPVERNAIAVLRFLAIDGSAASRTFSAGLSEDILDRLARLAGLRVAARGDAWSLPENAPSDIVRRRLRVAYFVEGSVLIVGDDLRVVAQLIDSATGRHVVSREFDRKLEDHIEVQREITDLIVSSLRVALPGDDAHLSALGVEQAPVDAYVRYRQGLDALYRPTTAESAQAALEAFAAALAIDPGFAVANAGRCIALLQLYTREYDAALVGDAEAACGAALETGGQLAEVRVAVGQLYRMTGRLDAARTAFRSALDINPRSARALAGLARVAEQQQGVDEAETLLRAALDMQPGNWQLFNDLAGLMFMSGRYAESATEYEHAAFLEPGNYVLLSNLGAAQILAGKFDAAARTYERSLAIEKNEEALSNLGVVHYLRGEFERAVEYHEQAVEAAPASPAPWANLGDALHFAGDRDGAAAAYARSARLADEALAVNPADADTMCIAAWAHAMQEQYVAAAALVEKAMAVAPRNPYPQYYAALIRTRTGDFDRANAAARRAIELGYPPSLMAAEPHLAPLRARADFAEATGSAGR